MNHPNSEAQPKILVLDNEKLIADSLAEIFNRSGFKAAAVYRAEDALELARSLKPDLFLSEVILHSGTNGIELSMLLCAAIPECKALFLSGDIDTADVVDRYRSQGLAVEVLAKPIEPYKLLQRVQEGLAGKAA